jgi:hypothetical protein
MDHDVQTLVVATIWPTCLALTRREVRCRSCSFVPDQPARRKERRP